MLIKAAFILERKNNNSKIMKYYNISILIYFGKAEFSAVITPVYSVTLSFRNHSVFYYTDLMFEKYLFLNKKTLKLYLK